MPGAAIGYSDTLDMLSAVIHPNVKRPPGSVVRMVVEPMGRLVQRFLAHVIPGVIRPLRALWNQLIGFIFLVLAATPIPSVVKSVRNYSGDSDQVFRLVLSVSFAALMAYFSITSFLRARRISRS